MNSKLSWIKRRPHPVRRPVRTMGRDESGATAVEFALVAVPFLMMLFGIISVGLYFFTTFSLENAVEQAARPIRTGEAQTAGLTKDQFKANICAQLPAYVECSGKLRINAKNYNVGDAISMPACVDSGGSLIADASTTYALGSSNQIMLVSACLEWTLIALLPQYIKLGTMTNGSALIMASTTYKIEPYSN